MIKFKVKCPWCGKEYEFNVTNEQYEKYITGQSLIQNIFPEIEPELRELLISEMCPDCWNKFIPCDEE